MSPGSTSWNAASDDDGSSGATSHSPLLPQRFERCVRDLMLEGDVPSAERIEMFKVSNRQEGRATPHEEVSA